MGIILNIVGIIVFKTSIPRCSGVALALAPTATACSSMMQAMMSVASSADSSSQDRKVRYRVIHHRLIYTLQEAQEYLTRAWAHQAADKVKGVGAHSRGRTRRRRRRRTRAFCIVFAFRKRNRFAFFHYFYRQLKVE